MFEDDKLTIVADLMIDDDGEDMNEDHDKELLINFKLASSVDKLSDFTIICGDEKLSCHKIILAIRSDVFNGMFSNNNEEMKANQVTIKDSTPPIVKVMLDFDK